VLPDAVPRELDVHVACLDDQVAWPLGLGTPGPSSSLWWTGATGALPRTKSGVKSGLFQVILIVTPT
jgi:hypothetical protein